MVKRIREDGLSNAFDRYALQEKIRCKFCLEGLSCQLCSDGPCRISEKGGQTEGVCGIGPGAMAMRTLLLHNIMGAGTYSHYAFEAFRTLKETAEGKNCFQLTDTQKLKWMCEKLGINTSQDDRQMAAQLADLLNAEMSKGPDKPNRMVEAFAPKKRKEVWNKIGIYPSGVIHEEQNCVASCLTNVDGDYVNIVFNGHQPWVGVATMQKAESAPIPIFPRPPSSRGLQNW
jgi:anaerobic carbon-monoxide dehydrogenase catalytic subunit